MFDEYYGIFKLYFGAEALMDAYWIRNVQFNPINTVITLVAASFNMSQHFVLPTEIVHVLCGLSEPTVIIFT
jgi:hypothetical protein